jgi:hypothetical protein
VDQQHSGWPLAAWTRIEEGGAIALSPGHVESARDSTRQRDLGMGRSAALEAAHLDRPQQKDHERHQGDDGDDAAHDGMEAARVLEVNEEPGTIAVEGGATRAIRVQNPGVQNPEVGAAALERIQSLSGDLGIVLVTGANGQLGRGLIERLAQRGDGTKARAVVRSERAAATLRSLPEDIRPEIVILDYGDAEALGEAARGCRFAVHLVGIIKETAGSRYSAAHEESSRSLADAAEIAGLERIVYISILGTNSGSRNECLASKGRAEQILIDGKTPAVVLRVPMVLGPGDRTAEILRHEGMAKLLPMVGGGRSHTQPIASSGRATSPADTLTM